MYKTQTVAKLVKKFGLREIPHHDFCKHEEIPCDMCQGKPKSQRRKCDWCQGTETSSIRSELVNAKRVFSGPLSAPGQFLIVADFGDWCAVEIRDEDFGLTPSPQWRLSGEELQRATSSSWNGEVAGSAIQRLPETIRGEMWRTYSTASKRGDSHVQPKCIVEYMLKNLLSN